MKFIIDLQSCQAGSRLGGIGRYALSLSKAFIKEAWEHHDVWLLLNNQMSSSMQDIRQEFNNLLPPGKIICFESMPNIQEYKNSLFKVRSAELMREKFLNDMQPDFTLVTSLFEGLHEDVVTSIGSLQLRPPTGTILYDLIPFVYQNKFLQNPLELAHYLRKIESLKRADLLLSISEFSRKEGLEILDISEKKIVNISSAVSEFFEPINISCQEKKRLFAELGIFNKFLMYTSSFDQRKNQKKLIKAYSLLPSALRKEYQLVIVGNGWDHIYNELKKYAISCSLNPSQIVFTGYVTDSQLLKLYNLASLFVFPSLFEGFGLPILEAMRCGVPSIGSNSTSIPEVIGRIDALFDPTCAQSIAAKIVEVLQNPTFYEALRIHALSHSRKFSWEISAKRSIAAFEEFHEKKQCKKKSIAMSGVSRNLLLAQIASVEEAQHVTMPLLEEIASTISVNEYICRHYNNHFIKGGPIFNEPVGIITTWNTKCGISTYSSFLMASYPDEYYVLAPNSQELIREDESFVIRCWKLGSDDLEELFQTLTKLNISIVLIQFNYCFFNFFSLSNLIENLEKNGIDIFIELHSTIDPNVTILDRQLKDLVPAFKYAKHLFVHSKADALRLSEIGLGSNVTIFPHGVNNVEPALVDFKKKSKDFIIAAYGFFLPHKGFHQLIRAFAKISVDYSNLKLLLVTAEYPAPISRSLINEAKKIAQELHIDQRMKIITDFLTDEQSLGYLMHADLIVYPYQDTSESASGAVRAGLATNIPVAVTPLGIFDDVKDLVHILPGIEVNSLAKGIIDLYQKIKSNDNQIKLTKKNCKLWVKTHEYKYLTQYLYSLISHSRPTVTQYTQNLHFDATSPFILTEIGKLSNAAICSLGKKGVLIYGPYANLQAGLYRMCVQGHHACDIWDAISVKLTHSNAQIEVNYTVVQTAGVNNNVLFEVTFFLESYVKGFEVQVFSKGGYNVEISAITFSVARKIH
ncbi:MAG: glycosyltransferase [Legionella sp.]|nr:glycosyltransferase [Legionella sp.]